ncbi:MAG: chromate transporter [Firmicutes bacterium]|nr:chromate transporter [Bacillota bacterium]
MLFQIFLTFFKVGLFTIGGGYAMLPIIQDAVCHEKGWLTDEEFLDSISLTNSLPGPLATNCATFIGFRLKKIPGSIAAILGTICPSIIIILLIAMVFNTAMDNVYVQAFFRGVGPAVFALIVSAVYKLSKSAKILEDKLTLIVALASFVVIGFLGVTPILVVIAAAVIALVADSVRKANAAKKEGGPDDGSHS